MKISILQPQAFSEIGRRDNQEDFLWPSPEQVTVANRVFILCDGMGGHDNGEVASYTAATALGTYLTAHPAPDGVLTKPMFEAALAVAYDALDKIDTGASKKPGTTLTCIVVHRGGVLAAHIGDSRIYHIRPSLATHTGRSGIIYQSEDHSLVNQLLRIGEITEEDAADFPQKNVITRAMQPHLERRHKADIYNITDVKPGDYFFLCSDGVLEQLTNDLLGEILRRNVPDEEKLQAIKMVCEGKTRDNHSCWLVPIAEVQLEATDVPTLPDAADDAAVLTCRPSEETEVEAMLEAPAEGEGCRICAFFKHFFSRHNDGK